MNKNIDISLLANAEATLKMTSKKGEIYTNFDVEMMRPNTEVKNPYKTILMKSQ